MTKEQFADLIEKESILISSFDTLREMEMNKGCVDGKIIGTGRSDYTQGSTIYDLTAGGNQFALIDIPGIEGDESKFEEIIHNSLDKAHAIFYVNGSGKKIEKATLEKIKKYMRDGTSVYAIFNVHCKAKKERIPGIDKTFTEELSLAYLKQDEIAAQTEEELSSFLGHNYKGCVSLNGLLSFCGLALNKDGSTTIFDEKEKNLRSDQQKYLKEYSFDSSCLVRDGRIALIKDIIIDKVDNLDRYIYNENIKKLRSRLEKMHSKIDELTRIETKKIKGFKTIYDEFISNCYNAKEDFIQTMRHIGYNAASDAFADVKSELFQMVETDKGKTKSSDIQSYFDRNKEEIIKSIQRRLNDKIAQAQEDYEDAIKDAKERLVKDFEREHTKFEISLSSSTLSLDGAIGDAFKYTLKSFGNDAFRVGSLAFSGAGIGSLIAPGIGTVIGAIVGVIAGILSSIWSFFASEEKRINKAKSNIERAIDEQIDEVSERIKSEMKRLDFEAKIDASFDEIRNHADVQKESLDKITRMLSFVTLELEVNCRKVS